MSQEQTIKGTALFNTTTNNSAIEECAALEIRATEKGLLLNGIEGSSAEAMQPKGGIIIYCNNPNGAVINEIGIWAYIDIPDNQGSTASWVKLHV